MKIFSLLIVMMVASLGADAQKYFTKSGNITFHSEAAKENIDAVNSKATSVIDMSSGAMQWAVLVKAFKFEKALMEEHFNENYMESSSFPKASFKGSIDNFSDLKLNSDGNYTANISGKLTIHGITKDITTTSTFVVAEGNVSATSSFEVKLQDYEIEIPSVVSNKISETIKIDVSVDYQRLEK